MPAHLWRREPWGHDALKTFSWKGKMLQGFDTWENSIGHLHAPLYANDVVFPKSLAYLNAAKPSKISTPLLLKGADLSAVAVALFTCCVSLMERPSSSSEFEPFSERSAQASRVPDRAALPTVAIEGCHLKATVMGPIRFLRAPPGFKMDGVSTSSPRRRPRISRTSLSYVVRAVENFEARVQIAVGEIDQTRAHTAHFERAWAESEARALDLPAPTYRLGTAFWLFRRSLCNSKHILERSTCG
ncbi:hypothetical protein Nepgr_007185 [Nepenthes gracilis]|uniref:Uncharacterized protein n=1 Tax=Nepenthes gracilis TaxID=150966 RepID=A0AAD3S6R0_NEPGR|nr:hypothetical protein Nepgr_007185 [Nepenthes gracilis]